MAKRIMNKKQACGERAMKLMMRPENQQKKDVVTGAGRHM